MTYKPKFSPEIYLRFLNKSLYLARDLSNKVSFRIFIGSKMIEFLGDSLEECLDEAIVDTGFEKNL